MVTQVGPPTKVSPGRRARAGEAAVAQGYSLTVRPFPILVDANADGIPLLSTLQNMLVSPMDFVITRQWAPESDAPTVPPEI